MPDWGEGPGLTRRRRPLSPWKFGIHGKANKQHLKENVKSRRGKSRENRSSPKCLQKSSVRTQGRSVFHSTAPWQWSHVSLPLNCVTATCGQETHIFIHEATLCKSHTAPYCFNTTVDVVTSTGAQPRCSQLPTFFFQQIHHVLYAVVFPHLPCETAPIFMETVRKFFVFFFNFQ